MLENKTDQPIEKGVIAPRSNDELAACQHEIAWQISNDWIRDVTSDKNFKPKLISGVFCIPKSDGSARLIYDGRALNEYLGNKRFQLPEAQAPLRNKFHYCAKLDLSNAFMHFKVNKKLQQY